MVASHGSRLARRATLFITTGPREHLHVVMNNPFLDPIRNAECVLLVNFCSYSPQLQHDSTCILESDDHPFITHSTYVDYKHAVIVRAAPLEADLAAKNLRSAQPVAEPVYQRILQGFLISPDVPRKITRFISHAGLLG